MNAWILAKFLVGLAMLVVGAELLVRGASKLASSLRVSPLVIGLTIVAFGTSAPELAVSVGAGLAEQSGIAIGNVVGSNVFNVLLILGIAAVVAPLGIDRKLLRFDVPVMVAASGALALVGLDGRLSRLEGALLFLGILAYTGTLIAVARRGRKLTVAQPMANLGKESHPLWKTTLANLGLAAAGLVLLVVGARWLIDSAVSIALALGVSELVLGLTVVAAGTSLPELATSVVASIRGERDIAVGNIVGSNIFNILAILGLAGLVAPRGIAVPVTALRVDIPVMIGVAVVCLPILLSGYRITRGEGLLFLGGYACYTAFLVLQAAGSSAASVLGRSLVRYALPMAVLVLGVSWWAGWRRGGRRIGQT